VVSFTLLPLYHRKIAPVPTGYEVESRAGLDEVGERKFFILPGLEL
jgi:hypothetical protein